MKHLIFSPTNECTNFFDEPQRDSVPYDFDPEVTWFSTLKLQDGQVVQSYPGLSRQEQEARFNADKVAADFEREKTLKIPMIKSFAGEKIRELDWKLERARELDELEGSTVRTQEILSQRQAIRAASNAVEAQVLACTTMEQLEAIDIRYW